MRIQILTKNLLVIILSTLGPFCSFGQDKIQAYKEAFILNEREKVDTSFQKTSIVTDTFPSEERVSIKEKAKPIINAISIDLLNGKNRSGYLSKLDFDSIFITNNYGKYNFNVTEIKTIKTYPKENKSVEGAVLGVFIGALPGILMLNMPSKSEGLFGGIAETITGAAVGIGGAIAGGIIGAQIGRGITVTYPINGSKSQYNKQKQQIINDAFKR
jgi:hypothetical protein